MRTTLIKAILAAFLLLQSPAHAQVPVADDVIARIEADGFTVIEVKRSWLGRIVITASDSTDLREVVLNRKSGEILRDQRFPMEDSEDRLTNPRKDAPDNRHRPDKPEGHNGPGGPSGSGGPGGHGGG